MNITFKLSLFKGSPARVGRLTKSAGLDRKNSEKTLLWLLNALVQTNREELKTNKIPPLYKSGVRYEREEQTEIWKDCVNILRDGFGDCEDLACWRVAELQNNGKKARPYIRYRVHPQTGMYIYHVMVQRANGKLEDPSALLGMNGVD